ncbi:hypothetical protein CEQ90_06885 [Lewinellaceae bacterium SD302]|nr:hypothetical protein CEQ90_06885 [Lewinellaceae bacterium SD302]
MNTSNLISKFSTATLLAIMLIFINTSASQLLAQDTTDLDPFNTVKIMGLIDVELIKGEEEKIVVRAFGDDADKLSIKQQNKTLKISTIRSLVIDQDLDIMVKVYYRDLEALFTAGGADVELREAVATEEFYARAGSGSELYLEINADKLDLQAAEGAHLTVRGTAGKLRAGANTGGILDGHRLVAQNGRLRAGTGGEVSATVEEELSAKANTGGIVRYAGDPKIQIGTILGGEVKRLAGNR